MSEKFRVVTCGFDHNHRYDQGDVVTLVQRSAPIPGLTIYARDTDGLIQALDFEDVEAIDE